MDAGALLRRARRERGLSQAALANAAGTSQPAVARLEAGGLSPSVDTLERLFKALNLRLELGLTPVDTGIDRTLIAERLRLSPLQRLRRLRDEVAGVERLRRAMPSKAR